VRLPQPAALLTEKAKPGMSATTFDGTAWDLSPADRLLVEAKRWGSRLRFAVMLLFYRAQGRFPRTAAEVDEGAVAELARTLGVPAPEGAALLLPEAADRTLERQRAEIRARLGFREASVADAEELGVWLRDNVVAETRDHGRLAEKLEERCRALRIEPPTPDRVGRIVRGAVRAYEDRLHAAIHAQLPPEVRERLDALLWPLPAGTGANDGEDEIAGQAAPGARALLNFVRGDPGKAGVAAVERGLERLEAIRTIGLPPRLFAGVLPHECCHTRWRCAGDASRCSRRRTCAACPNPRAWPGSPPTPTCAAARSPTTWWSCWSRPSMPSAPALSAGWSSRPSAS
jgi:hypothetical protein